MAHYQQLKFVELVGSNFPDFFRNKKILEVGSWIANETIRDFFKDCEYIGADIAEGPGVDVVCPGERLEFADESFDVVASCECFEHNPNWSATFKNMHRMLKPGGLFLMTCATIGRREHGTTRKSPNASLTVESGHEDYYANISKGDISKQFDLNSMFDSIAMFYNIYSRDLYFIGFKKSKTRKNNNLKKLRDAVSKITNTPEPRLNKKIERTINFWLTFAYAKWVGEETYHDRKLQKHLTRTTLNKN